MHNRYDLVLRFSGLSGQTGTRAPAENFPEGGGGKNSSDGWVTGNIFQIFFSIEISLFLNIFRKNLNKRTITLYAK